MVWIRAASFSMGSNDFYPEEAPVHQVAVASFWIDLHPVTNAEFRRFVKATGYVTLAEQVPDRVQYPDADPDLLVPGSLVFRKTDGPVDLRDHRNWWTWLPGAQWRHPEGPGSTLHGRDRHPVTHVASEDAEAYASWAGKEIPTEAEWELAARGGLEGKVFPWGDEFAPTGRMMANTWQGAFPWQNLGTDGFEGTSPVKSFPPNGYGLFDVVGNVWEWTSDVFPSNQSDEEHGCCAPSDPRAASADEISGVGRPTKHIARRVTKGGSHLCAPNYCLRYRPAARQGQAVDSSTGHIGFRCVVRTSRADQDPGVR
jgi:sulfatase modifying factor 1